ncbi:DUF1254 domain-containing protein [Methanosarcina sp. 2.H.A.1B.4]|uniref:DUF1254 domain-containing protein n=1 Tax=Methanosarcina sp. 2.H.A.1B.4 TaxID=1483600 RepID=UPI000621DC3E|nr:DUF1214 domain-containing protein [Methanosarcina sp. 2.H.A.1B.4]KKG07764.1 hypothetical protein EO92_04215 [Methanosarcina sp. 2.H.A.1B.4]
MNKITPQESKKIAKEAYIFGFPFVANYRVFMYPLISGHPLMQGAGFNQFAHNRQLFPPQTRDTTQRDTIFSLGILDLRREPVVISVPDVPEGQVYMLQMGDTSTESLPYISTLTTGNKAGNYVLVGPDFQGYLPAPRFKGVITTRGQFVIMLGRTVVFDPRDLSLAHAVQDGMQMRPLSQFLGSEPPQEVEPVDFLPWKPEAAEGLGIFDYINMALAWHPPAIYEMDTMAEFAQIGVIPGRRFTTEGLSPENVRALEDGVAEARAIINEMANEGAGELIGSWSWTIKDISRFGRDYLTRAAVSLRNIYPNAPDHAIYGSANRDQDGNPLRGTNTYKLRFEAGELPPVNWFWSVTLYDTETTAMYPNPLERYSIGNRTEDIKFDDDGSLTLTIGHAEPEDKSNWLPAPEGCFYLIIRLYGAKPEVFEGKWTPPPVRRI